MRNIIILLSMIFCLFGPMTIFALVGRKAMKTLSDRPTNSAKVMIALITKLVIVTVVIMGLLVVLLKSFAK